jgi:hypothetical protein
MKTKFKSEYPASFKVSLNLSGFILQNTCLQLLYQTYSCKVKII